MESNNHYHNQDQKEIDSNNIRNNNYGERDELNEQYNKDTAMFIKNQDSGNILVENQSYNNTETREFYNNKNLHSLHSDYKQDNEININDNQDNSITNENNDNMRNTSISKAKSNNSLNEPLFIMNLELENQNVELKIFRDSIPEQLAYEFCNKHALDFDSMSYLKAEIDELLYKYNINQKTSSSAVVEDNEINYEDEAKNSNINNINNQNAGYNNNFENHENSSTRKSYGNTKKSEFHIIYEEDKEEALGKGDTKDIEHDKSLDKNYDVFNKFNLNNDNSNRNIINASNNSNKMNNNSNSKIYYNENLPNNSNSTNQYDNSKNPYRNKPTNVNHNIEDSNHLNNHSNNVNDDHDTNEEFIYNSNNQTSNNNEEHSHIIGISQASNFNNMNDPSIFNQDTNRVDISKTDSRNNNNNNNYSKNNRELDESIGVRLSQDSINNDDDGNQEKNNQEQNINLSTLNTNPNNSKINLNINNKSNSNNNNKKEYAYSKSKSKPKYFSNQITSDIVPRKNKSMSKYNNSNYSNTASNFNKYNFFKNNEVNNISKTKNAVMYTNRNLSNEKLYNSSKRLWNQDVFTHLYEDAKSKKMKKLIAENNKIQEENNNFLKNLNEFKNNFPITKISEKCQDTGEDLYLRGKKNKDKVSRKLHLMKNKASDKQYEECSFTPQINKQGVFKHVQSKNVQSLDYKEFQNNRNNMLNKIKENIQSDEEENTFKPIINNKKKYENMKPLVYDIKDTYIKKIKAEERVLNEKAKKEYYRPIVSSSKNDKILSTSRLYGKTNNVSDLRNTNSYSVNSNEIDNNNYYYGISNNDGELAGMLNYNKKNKDNQGDNENTNDDNILIKDNLNNNNDFNNRTKRVIKFSTNSENQGAAISRPKYNNTTTKSTNISTTNSNNINTNTNINTKTCNNNSTNTKNSNFYISPSFDARQELYKELHEKKISSLQKDREREERMKSESITIIINKHHSQHNLKKENYNKKNQESQDCLNNINSNSNNTQENQLKFSSDDIFTKNYEYANIYKSKKEKLSKSSQEKFLITCNKQKSDNNSVRLYQEKLNQQFKKLFSVLDFDHDDLITKRSVGVKRLSKKLAEIVSPLIKELIEEDETLNCEEFIQAMSHLNNCLSYFEKNELIKEIEAIKETSNYISYREFNYYNNSGNYNENQGEEFYNNRDFDNKSHHNKVGFYSDQHSKTINNFNINYNISNLNNYNNNNSNNNTSNILLNTPYKQNSEMNIHMNQTLSGLNSGRSSHNISKINNTNNNNHTSSKKNAPYSSSIFNIKKNNFSNMNNALSRINSSSNNVVNKKNRYDPYSDMTFKPKINSNSRRIDSQKTYGLV